MPTIFAHALVPAALGLGLGTRRIPSRLLIAGIAAAMLPDADVIGFKLGIAYADALGHRGASHSIVFALLLGTIAACLHRCLHARPWTAFVFIAIAAVSHPLLDMLTNGGHGVALFWPVSLQRLFLPWQVIEVSPFAHNFFSARGVEVLKSEAYWIGLPALGLMLLLRAGIRCRPQT